MENGREFHFLGFLICKKKMSTLNSDLALAKLEICASTRMLNSNMLGLKVPI